MSINCIKRYSAKLLYVWPALGLVAAMLLHGTAQSAPRVPKADSEVLERLPLKASDPVGRELRALRARLNEAPDDPERAVALARRYFDIAGAEGDPRYIGYAEAVLRPWAGKPDAPVEVVFTAALLKQYRHRFAEAMADLDAVLDRDPGHGEALSWKWALHMVQAEYDEARAVCERRRPVASALALTACFATVDGVTGKARPSYASLQAALAQDPKRDAEFRQWILTRLGELALRGGEPASAERHFREAIATGVIDGFVLAAYADLLIDAGRPAEVVSLLKDWTRSDILLLRLALAERALGSPSAAAHAEALANRFADATLRGDRLHLQEEARFELQLRHDAARALELALENWREQREPRDARVLMEAALAARRPDAAQPALEWMRRTGYEETRYRALVEQLRKMPK